MNTTLTYLTHFKEGLYIDSTFSYESPPDTGAFTLSCAQQGGLLYVYDISISYDGTLVGMKEFATTILLLKNWINKGALSCVGLT